MSHKTRLTKLERSGGEDRPWALIGIGKPRDSEHQRELEKAARASFYASGGDRSASLGFLPFADFNTGFICYTRRSEFSSMVNLNRERARKIDGTPR